MTAKSRATRAGFTLVELLMVIAIIAILASLLIVGVSKVRESARIVQARNDLTQLETVLTTFKKEFGFYPPSHVTCNRTNNTNFVARFFVPTHFTGYLTGDAGLQNDASFNILQRMFPRWQPAYDTTSGKLTNPPTGSGLSLDPNVALVYFLNGPSLTQPGWDVASPYAPTGGTKKGPYFDFPAARINPSNQFVDPWGTPYAYFSASGDNYDPRVYFPWTSDPAPPTYDGTAAGNYGSDPNRTTTFTVHPYGSNGKWLNSGKFQIISAGPDRLFGPGSFIQNGATTVTHVWDAKNPQANANSAVYYGEGGGDEFKTPAPLSPRLSRGTDDLANFNEGSALGTSNN